MKALRFKQLCVHWSIAQFVCLILKTSYVYMHWSPRWWPRRFYSRKLIHQRRELKEFWARVNLFLPHWVEKRVSLFSELSRRACRRRIFHWVAHQDGKLLSLSLFNCKQHYSPGVSRRCQRLPQPGGEPRGTKSRNANALGSLFHSTLSVLLLSQSNSHLVGTQRQPLLCDLLNWRTNNASGTKISHPPRWLLRDNFVSLTSSPSLDNN